MCLAQKGLTQASACLLGSALVEDVLRDWEGSCSNVRLGRAQGSGKVLKHCFWTCSFSWSPPDSRHGQTGQDRGQSPCIHRGGPSLVYKNFPGSLRNLSICWELSSHSNPSPICTNLPGSPRNLSICREVSSHSDLSSCRELPPTHLAAPHHTTGLQGCSQQHLQAQVSPGNPRLAGNPKTLYSPPSRQIRLLVLARACGSGGRFQTSFPSWGLLNSSPTALYIQGHLR